MVNLFGLVSTDRERIKRHPEPVGKDNDVHIRRMAAKIPAIFVAWGTYGRYRNRDGEVIRLLAGAGRKDLYCFGTNKDGSPKHPLRLSGKVKPAKWLPANNPARQKKTI